MGLLQHRRRARTAARLLRFRICLRKGRGGVYHPTQWNQRYCQEAGCLREVRRWQAANDSTSISFFGQYEAAAQEDQRRGKPTPAVT